MPEVPAVPDASPPRPDLAPGLETRVAEALADEGALARAMPAFEPRPGQRRMAARRGAYPRHRRRAAGRSRNRDRQDPGVPRPRHPQRTARPHLDRHEEPAGPDLLQGPPRSAGRARRRVSRHVHEGTRQLPLPAPLRDGARGGDCLAAAVGRAQRPRPARRMGRPDRDGRPGRDRGPSRQPGRLERRRGHVGELHRHGVPRVPGVLRDDDAPARGGVGRGHRQPPPAVRGCRRAPERLRRGNPGVHDRGDRRSPPARRRGDAVLRHLGQHPPARRAVPRRAATRRRRRAPGGRARGVVGAGADGAARWPAQRCPPVLRRARAGRRGRGTHAGDRRHALRGRRARPPPGAQPRRSRRGAVAAGRAVRKHGPGGARPASGRDAHAARVPAGRRRHRVRLLRGTARAQPVPARRADRRVEHHPRAADRADGEHGPDLRHADGRCVFLVPAGAAWA